MGKIMLQSLRDLLSSILLCILLKLPVLSIILVLVYLAVAPK